ncbi:MULTISPECIES: hypothetical protein [unclassified Rhodococcus (in: high G+C Gram-positive bacteria)]|uniref:hypothetical protein n=1 Tax=unclassified Rhodococcus (in: high G+C Gram-positive bacteria) TaxID=192944 RepID=UPI000B9BA0AC|nr:MULTISPECIES: hypothetical protein [unclassified Rhodococcus (in: high G+C Gram-positive bacteria)]OZC72571.1 hypothetical protein CH277_00835 [Rhodococcus sp. 06-469-3-2]OZD48797.1 hypothetical protein CH264_06060 [Rhodococcus sp. 06-1477-1A]
MTRRRWLIVLPVVAVLVVGLSVYFWPEPSPKAAIATVPSCVDDREVSSGVLSGATLSIPPRPEFGSRPAGFTVASVMVCGNPGEQLVEVPFYAVRQLTYSGDGIDEVAEAFAATSYRFRVSILYSCSGDYLPPTGGVADRRVRSRLPDTISEESLR